MKKSDWKKVIVASTISVVVGAVVLAVIFIRSRKISCSSSMLFIGDSHTAGSWSYADKIMDLCKNKNSRKIAKVGANTTWIAQELDKELQKNKYDLVVILGGSNDIFGSMSIDKAKANMNEMLDQINKAGGKSVVINPPSKKFYSGATQKHMELIKGWTAFLESHKLPIKFINFEKLTQDQDNFAGDMIHINTKGHEKLSNYFVDKFKLT